jgi:pimeloyl-ACP methyl ester carboxylesterase
MPKIYVNNRNLFYHASGHGDPLVFLAGLGGDHRSFSVTVRYFSDRFQCLALDARDAGQSDRAQTAYTTADMADDVAAWLDALKLSRAHVVGHSLGGLTAQQLALKHPEKVRSLVLVSSHAGANVWRRAVIDSWVIMRARTELAEFTRITMPWLVAPRFYEHNDQVEGLIRFAERNEWEQPPDAFARQAKAAAEHDLRGRLEPIRAPTLVISGALDLLNPPRIARALAEEIPAAELVLLPEAGHLPHIEDGPKFREALGAFLNLASAEARD